MSSTRISNQMSDINNLIDSLTNIQVKVENPISLMHNYLAKKPYNVIKEIIETLTNESDIVLDGFMGSGTTGYEALKAKRRFIGVDINKLSINYFNNVAAHYDISKYDELISKLLSEIHPQIDKLYKTRCPICSNDSLIERISFDQNESKELIIKRLKYICYKCTPKRKTGIFIEARKEDQIEYDNIFLRTEVYTEIFQQKLLENKHIAIQPNAQLGDYFCNRGKIAIGIFKNAINSLPNIHEKELVLFTFSSSLHFFKLSDYKASTQIPYWQPKTNIVRRNSVPFFLQRYKKVREGIIFSQDSDINYPPFEDLTELYKSNFGSYIIHDSILSSKVKNIKDSTVSLIITDPPYSDQVPYLEYSGIWDKVLDLNNMTDDQLEKEIIVSNSPKRKKKNELLFNKELGESIIEMSRVLKDQKFLCMFYHDFSLSYWKGIMHSANRAGLAFVTQVHIGRNQKSLKTVWSPNRTLDGSALVFFKKDFKMASKQSIQNTDILRAEMIIKNAADLIIEKREGKATSQELYDLGVLNTVIKNNSLEILSSKYKNFIQLFKKFYEFEDGFWTQKK